MKLLKPIGVTILAIVILFACTKDNDVSIETSGLDIEQELKAYNASIVSSKKGGKFWKIVVAILADAAGGAVGGLVGSAVGGPIGAASIGGACAAGATSAATSTNPGGSADPAFEAHYLIPDGYQTWDIGENHNDFMRNVFHGDQELNQYILDSYGTEMHRLIQTEDITNMLTKTNQISYTYGQNGFDHNFLVQQFNKQGLISDQVSRVLDSLFRGLLKCNTDDDVSNILKFYSDNILKSSDLTENDKISLFSALSVLRSSANYWSHLPE